ncbi:hypothetical protein [Streptomyces ureilyticus]|uniref:Uncharacterized protein n=1 Tax=Streptomyces ureilyticus TaxID=1775131 RepID=A0ABX0DQ45_9ACTN|nr:hypothetical protein [Streptomyces ureilyticus]NGO43990.1 hypothetical protein [Streptomyces ureilyticus]
MSTAAQGGPLKSDAAVRTAGSPTDREREEAEPYVRAAHAGRFRHVAGSSGGQQSSWETLASQFASL